MFHYLYNLGDIADLPGLPDDQQHLAGFLQPAVPRHHRVQRQRRAQVAGVAAVAEIPELGQRVLARQPRQLRAKRE